MYKYIFRNIPVGIFITTFIFYINTERLSHSRWTIPTLWFFTHGSFPAPQFLLQKLPRKL